MWVSYLPSIVLVTRRHTRLGGTACVGELALVLLCQTTREEVEEETWEEKGWWEGMSADSRKT